MAKLARASALQFGANILQTVFGAIATIYFVRVLGARGFGQYALALAVMSWISIPSVGIRSGTEKRISEANTDAQYYTAGLLLQTIYIFPAIGLLIFLSGYVDNYIGFPGTPFVAALFVTRGYVLQYISTLRGEGMVEMTSILETGWKLSTTLIQFLLIFTGGGVASLLYGEIISSVLAIGVGALLTNERICVPTIENIVDIYTFGKYGWLSNFKGTTYSWIDTFILGFFVSDSIIGAYEVAWRISGLFTVLPWAIVSVSFQAFSQRSSLQEYSKITNLAERTLSFGGLLAIPGVVGAYIIGSEILSIYGQSVAAISLAPTFLVILAIARLGESYEMIVTTILNGIDRPEITFRIGGIFVLINLVLNILLTMAIGPVGAAIATVMSVTISLILSSRALKEIVNFTIPIQTIGSQIISSIIMGAVVGLLLVIHSAESIPVVLLYVLTGVGCYTILVIIISNSAREQLRRVLREISSQ